MNSFANDSTSVRAKLYPRAEKNLEQISHYFLVRNN